MAAVIVDIPRENGLWSGSLETLEQRMEYFLENDFLADMTFLVGEDRKRVPGHKFLLSSCSWDFHNALHLLRIDSNELPIEDVPYESFLVFLRYCYTGRAELSSNNAIDVLKLACRFDMKPLIKKCEITVQKMINSQSCINLLNQCDFLPRDSPLKKRILNVIAINFTYILKIPAMTMAFQKLSLKAVKDVSDLNVLPCDELLMFETLMKWSETTCIKAGIERVPQNLRKALGETFYRIRFPTINSQDFMKIVAKYSMIFTGPEILHIAKRMNDTTTDPAVELSRRYPSIPRKMEDPFKIDIPWFQSESKDLIFTSPISNTPTSIPMTKFSVGFKVNSRKKLLGFGVIGRKNLQKPVLKSCYFRKPCWIYDQGFKGLPRNQMISHDHRYHPCSTFSEVAVTTVAEKHDLSYDYSLKDYSIFPIIFNEEKILEPNKFYVLLCEFSSDPPAKSVAILNEMGTLEASSIPARIFQSYSETAEIEVVRKEKEGIIPFLYFAK